MTRRIGAAKRLPELTAFSFRRRVLDTLRTAIIGGNMKPGHRLIEEDLCAELGVSRGPIREALRELEVEGLIVSTPYKGTEVLDISDREVFELLMPIRFAIEEFGFRHAIGRMTDDGLADLQDIIEHMTQAAERDDVNGVALADVAFHEKVLQISGQTHCLQIWRTISPRVRAYFARVRQGDPNLTEVVLEHRLLLRDIRSRDASKTIKHLHEHIFSQTSIVNKGSQARAPGAAPTARSGTKKKRKTAALLQS